MPDHVTLADANQQGFSLPSAAPAGGWWVRIYSTSDCYFVYPDKAADATALPTVAYVTVPAGLPTPFLVHGSSFAVAGAAAQVVEVVAL